MSIICFARGPRARSAHSCSSSKKSESDFVFGSKLSLGHLCFAVACDCGLTCFRRNMMSTSSSVCLLLPFSFLNVCSASFRKCEWKWLIFIASDFSSCPVSIVWKKSSNRSKFLIRCRRLVCSPMSALKVLTTFGVVVKMQYMQLPQQICWQGCLSLKLVFVVFVQPLAMCFRVNCMLACFAVE